MRKCKAIVAMATVTVCWATVAQTATAQPEAPLLPAATLDGGGVAPGVARAQAAGIMVSPEAAQIMAQAPAESCLADPTAARCPAVTAVVAVNSEEEIVAEPENVAVAAGCEATAGRPSVAMRNGRLQAYGAGYSDCGSAVNYQELYTTLYKYLDGRWNQMAVASRTKNGGGSIGATAWAKCNHATYRSYMTEAFVYSEQNGTGYADADTDINDLVRC